MRVLSLEKNKPMTSEEIYAQLIPIIALYLPEDVSKEAITKESNLTSELNINSAHLVDVVLDVEDKFNIEFANTDMEQLQTINDAIEIIGKKLST
jgi:acyl carrier protein